MRCELFASLLCLATTGCLEVENEFEIRFPDRGSPGLCLIGLDTVQTAYIVTEYVDVGRSVDCRSQPLREHCEVPGSCPVVARSVFPVAFDRSQIIRSIGVLDACPGNDLEVCQYTQWVTDRLRDYAEVASVRADPNAPADPVFGTPAPDGHIIVRVLVTDSPLAPFSRANGSSAVAPEVNVEVVMGCAYSCPTLLDEAADVFLDIESLDPVCPLPEDEDMAGADAERRQRLWATLRACSLFRLPEMD